MSLKAASTSLPLELLRQRRIESEQKISTEKSKPQTSKESWKRLPWSMSELIAAAVITEKRGKNFDKVVGEWKAKAEDIQAELEASHSESRNFNAEGFRHQGSS